MISLRTAAKIGQCEKMDCVGVLEEEGCVSSNSSMDMRGLYPRTTTLIIRAHLTIPIHSDYRQFVPRSYFRWMDHRSDEDVSPVSFGSASQMVWLKLNYPRFLEQCSRYHN